MIGANPETGNGITIRPDERVAIIGKTGSGKTYWARAVLQSARRLIVCDSKGKLTNSAGWNLVPWREGYRALARGRDARVRILSPRYESEWDDYFSDIYRLRNVIVYIDELYGVGPPSGSPGLRALYTRGRELGIGVWASTQRPKLIPLFALSEAEWIILFQLRLRSDIDRMAELIGPPATVPLRGHQFIVYNDTIDRPRKFDHLETRATG